MLRRGSSVATAGLLVATLGAAASASPGRANGPGKPSASTPPLPHALGEWRDRTPARANSASIPPAAEDCAAVYEPLRHRLILFGGKDDRDTLMNQLWGLDLVHNKWQQIKTVGPMPPPREDAALIYDPVGDRLILHGGEDGFTSNQAWSFDLKSLVWRSLGDSLSPKREEHSAIYDSRGKRMVLFGGRDNDWVDIHEVWALDLDPRSRSFERWHNLTVEVGCPPGRTDHVAIYDSLKNRMVVFGGYGKQRKADFGDTWAYEFPTPPDSLGHWEQIARADKSFHPPARRHTAAAYDSSRNWLIIFGGFGEEGYLNDVWALDLTKDAWINITPGPEPRIDHKAIYDPGTRRMILYGGDARLGAKFHDVWELRIPPDLPLDPMLRQARGKRAR